MKRWIQRTLYGLLGAGALLGGLAAWAGYERHDWHSMGTEEHAEMRARMLDRVARQLELDAAQKARLGVLADALHRQRQAIVGATEPRAEMQSLVAGPVFDRARAGALIETKLAAVQRQAPQAVNALADFYDSLRPEQQAKVREFMNRGWRHGGRG